MAPDEAIHSAVRFAVELATSMAPCVLRSDGTEAIHALQTSLADGGWSGCDRLAVRPAGGRGGRRRSPRQFLGGPSDRMLLGKDVGLGMGLGGWRRPRSLS